MEDSLTVELTPRQWWLYRLIKKASEENRKLYVAEIVQAQDNDKANGILTFDDLYQFKDADGNHSNCPQMYEDKDIINECDRIDKILCVSNGQFYLGNESETIKYHNKLMHNVCRDSHKAKIIRDKISQDGQGKLFTFDLVQAEQSQGRDYHEAFVRHENLLKELEKKDKEIADLKKLIQTYKNENQMWKDRYYALKDMGCGKED